MKYGLLNHYNSNERRIVRLDATGYKIQPDGTFTGRAPTYVGFLDTSWITESYAYDSGFQLCVAGNVFELMTWCSINNLGPYMQRQLSELI